MSSYLRVELGGVELIATPPIHHKPIPHVPDSTQPVSTHQFFSTKLVLHPFPVSANEYISGR